MAINSNFNWLNLGEAYNTCFRCWFNFFKINFEGNRGDLLNNHLLFTSSNSNNEFLRVVANDFNIKNTP